jgi:Polyketide cyclase / dehydrase and lipid transport
MVKEVAMEYRAEISLDVAAGRVWHQLAALRSWPDWTPTVESIETDVDHPQVGAAVAIKQPGRSLAHYRIDLVEDGRRFRWGSNRGGVRQSADHVVKPTGDATCDVTLSFAMSGPLGGLLGALAAGKIRHMVDAEANALRTAVAPEQRPS